MDPKSFSPELLEDDGWNDTRENLEIAALRAAHNLLMHSGASGVTLQGFGVTIRIEEITAND